MDGAITRLLSWTCTHKAILLYLPGCMVVKELNPSFLVTDGLEQHSS